MPPPRLTGDLHVADTADQLYDDLASVLMATAFRALEKRGGFQLALSGGKTPEPFYMRLMLDPRFRFIPWKDTHLWLVDERCVPLDDERSNFCMIRQILADQVPTPRRQVHDMPATEPDAAEQYEAALRTQLGDDGALDFVLLGMGDDGHTASLFPQSPALAQTERWVVPNEGPTVIPPPRLTMTYPLLNGAAEVAILVTGANKWPAIRRVDEQLRKNGPDPQHLPVTGIEPEDGELTWYLDAAAAGGEQSS